MEGAVKGSWRGELMGLRLRIEGVWAIGYQA